MKLVENLQRVMSTDTDEICEVIYRYQNFKYTVDSISFLITNYPKYQ